MFKRDCEFSKNESTGLWILKIFVWDLTTIFQRSSKKILNMYAATICMKRRSIETDRPREVRLGYRREWMALVRIQLSLRTSPPSSTYSYSICAWRTPLPTRLWVNPNDTCRNTHRQHTISRISDLFERPSIYDINRRTKVECIKRAHYPKWHATILDTALHLARNYFNSLPFKFSTRTSVLKNLLLSRNPSSRDSFHFLVLRKYLINCSNLFPSFIFFSFFTRNILYNLSLLD